MAGDLPPDRWPACRRWRHGAGDQVPRRTPAHSETFALTIRPATPADAAAIAAIYRPVVEHTAISFETCPPTRDEIAERIARAQSEWAYLVATMAPHLGGAEHAVVPATIGPPVGALSPPAAARIPRRNAHQPLLGAAPGGTSSRAPLGTISAKHHQSRRKALPRVGSSASDEEVVGYAYGSAHRPRAAYRYSVEVSAYVATPWRQRGIAANLYAALFPALREKGHANAYAGIALPNAASIALHERLGFAAIGVFPRVGYKFERWHDVGWYHRSLDDVRTQTHIPTP